MGLTEKPWGRGCTIMGVPFTTLTFAVNTEFKQRPFWATLVNQKWAFFFFICLGTTRFVKPYHPGVSNLDPRAAPAQTRKHWGGECGRHLSLDPGAFLLGIIKIWNISKFTATNQSAWYSRLANEPRTLAPWIGSIQFNVNERESWNCKLILTARRWRS